LESVDPDVGVGLEKPAWKFAIFVKEGSQG